ncbi:UNVERIFIED_CONTAM: protein FAR1-RELATED SEQUENCE 5 [Sesamum radiatum]|uniref:Protein FAR1-RELATED SEQUENCE 5 n=1 Tax=Sesamum radiatum TaxID=300843 RepID=A0AAW2UP18_SESRA
MRYKAKETGYIEPYTEVDDSDVDNKLMEIGSHIRVCGGGETISLYDKKNFTLQELHANTEPYVGMEFESEEAAMAYYDAYAKRVGFIIRIGNCHRSSHDGSVISRRFLCNKEGFRVNKKERLEVRRPRQLQGRADEKDKRIHELSAELHRTKQQLAKCQKQLDAVLNDVELHVNHLTRSIQHIVQNVKEVGDQYPMQL